MITSKYHQIFKQKIYLLDLLDMQSKDYDDNHTWLTEIAMKVAKYELSQCKQ